MVKLIILIALVCLGLVSAGGNGRQRGDSRHDNSRHDNSRHDDSHRGGDNHYGGPIGGRDYGNTGESRFCANSTLVQSYVKQMQAVITQLNNNGSFTDFFEKRKEETSYLQNADNTALLTSNCTQYFKGLDSARTRDKVAQNLRDRYTEIANQLLGNILQNCQTRFRDYGRRQIFPSLRKY
ncbi:unnamed protein product [Rotaria sordida]|uniref:Uncharacterized protein n=1 Tax=Rotaria sordida TaxID=392033 RepID=A0A819WVB1_9BILA|nr:unnamed protein product [Rotaria sordida]CAF4132383.1 unnamed protein product [Rotaria sordida]